MGAGVSLIVFGALLTFAVRIDLSGFSFQAAGMIFMIAGVALVIFDLWRQNRRRTEITETVDDNGVHEVRRTVRDETYE